MCDLYAFRIRQACPNDFWIWGLCVGLGIRICQAGFDNIGVLAQNHAVVAHVLTVDEIHGLCICLGSILGYRGKVYHSITGCSAGGINTLAQRVIISKALEYIVKSLEHTLTGSDGSKHINVAENTHAIFSIKRTTGDIKSMYDAAFGVHEIYSSRLRACQCLRGRVGGRDRDRCLSLYGSHSVRCGFRQRLCEDKNCVFTIGAPLHGRYCILGICNTHNITSCDIGCHSGIPNKTIA